MNVELFSCYIFNVCIKGDAGWIPHQQCPRWGSQRAGRRSCPVCRVVMVPVFPAVTMLRLHESVTGSSGIGRLMSAGYAIRRALCEFRRVYSAPCGRLSGCQPTLTRRVGADNPGYAVRHTPTAPFSRLRGVNLRSLP